MSEKPVAFFWDVENVPVPKGKSPFFLIQRIRNQFLTFGTELAFVAVLDVLKEDPAVTEEMNSANITVVHVRSYAKNAVDDKLKSCIMHYANAVPASSTVVLISSDINYSSVLSDCRNRRKQHVVIIHREASRFLLEFGNECHLWETFTEDLPPIKCLTVQGKAYLLVTNLPNTVAEKSLKEDIQMLIFNTGGHIDSLKKNEILLSFASGELASRAKSRLDNTLLLGYKMDVTFVTNKDKRPLKKNNSTAPKQASDRLAGTSSLEGTTDVLSNQLMMPPIMPLLENISNENSKRPAEGYEEESEDNDIQSSNKKHRSKKN